MPVLVTRRHDPPAVGRWDRRAPRRAGRIEGISRELRGKRRRIERRSEMQCREDAATRPRLDQASVPRQPLPGAIRRPPPEITAYGPPADIIELRDDQRVAEPVVAHLTVDTMRTQHATARDVAYADATSAATVVEDIGDRSAVGRDTRRRLAAETAGDECARRDQCSRDRRRDRLLPRLVEWHADEAQRPAHAKRNELSGCALNEARDDRVAAPPPPPPPPPLSPLLPLHPPLAL